MTPDVMLQYRGIANRFGAMVVWIREVEGGYVPGFRLFEGDNRKGVLQKLHEFRDHLALDASIQRIVMGEVQQELRRKPAEVDGKVVLPFNRTKQIGLNGRH